MMGPCRARPVREMGWVALACAMLPGLAMAQNVLWEDYRGENSVPPDSQYIGTPDAPKFQNFPNSSAMAPFRALTANPANAARTGTSADIDFRQSPSDLTALCDNAAGGGWQNSQACQHQAQGRVLYALISFPQAGDYTLAAAHDDNLVVELSTDYANTNYRNASYDIPVGALAEWTPNDEVFETVGTFNAANADSCALIRVFWTNQAGVNHTRLQWTLPDGSTEIVPASAYRDPSLPTSADGCVGSISGEGTAITLNKVLGSERLDAGDQFVIEIGTTQTGGTVRSAQTSGDGTGQQASTGAFPAATNVTYYLREVMAPGSASALTAYEAEIACTLNGAPFAPTPVGAPEDRRWSVTPGTNDQIVCAITNTAPTADLAIVKTSGEDVVTSGEEVEYALVVTNNGPADVTGAVVTDAPGPGISCAATDTVTCTSTASPDACPAPSLPLGDLLAGGIVLGTLPAVSGGNSVTLVYACTAD